VVLNTIGQVDVKETNYATSVLGSKHIEVNCHGLFGRLKRDMGPLN
jgi:hypothetical protein